MEIFHLRSSRKSIAIHRASSANYSCHVLIRCGSGCFGNHLCAKCVLARYVLCDDDNLMFTYEFLRRVCLGQQLDSGHFRGVGHITMHGAVWLMLMMMFVVFGDLVFIGDCGKT